MKNKLRDYQQAILGAVRNRLRHLRGNPDIDAEHSVSIPAYRPAMEHNSNGEVWLKITGIKPVRSRSRNGLLTHFKLYDIDYPFKAPVLVQRELGQRRMIYIDGLGKVPLYLFTFETIPA